MKKHKINLKTLIISFAVVFLTALIGSFFTGSETKSQWYESIKPSITPPNYVFPIVWNILFFLIALSLYLSFVSAKTKILQTKVKMIFALNLLFNLLWSYFFFTLKNPLIAFFDLLILWITILLMIFLVKKINKTAAFLLVPYLLWVSFAGILNFLMAFA